MHDKVVSFLQDRFMEDSPEWNEFSRDHTHVGSLNNAGLLRIYWFAQGQRESWVGSRLPKHLNNKKVEIVSLPMLFCVLRCNFFFDCDIVRFSPGTRPRCAWSHGGLVSGLQRDSLACDCVW